MAEIPYTKPEEFDLERIRPTDFNSKAVGRGMETVSRDLSDFDIRMLRLEQNQQMADGELASDQHISTGMTKIQEGKDYKNAPADFANVIEQRKQEIENSDYSDGVKRHLLHDLGMKQAQYGSQMAAWSYSGQMTDAKASLNTYVTTMRDQYANSGSDVLRGQIKQKVQAMVQNNVSAGMITQADADDIMAKINNEYDDNAAALDVARNPQAALDRLNDSKQYQYLDGKQRAEYIDRARNQIKENEAANSAMNEGMVKDQIDSALTYGTYNAAGYEAAKKQLKPEMQALADKRLRLSLDAHSANIAISRGTPQEREAALEEYKPKPGADDFEFRENMYERLASLKADIDGRLTTDPASVVQDDIDRKLPIPQQIQQSLALQQKMGATAPRILTTAKAKDYADEYNNAPPDQKGAFVAALKTKTGVYFGQAAAEMYGQGMKPSFMFADRGTDVITKLAILDESGEAKLKESVGDEKWKALSDDVDKQAGVLAQILPPGAPAQLAQAKGTFLKLAAYYKSTGDQDPVGHAQSDLFGDYTIKGNWAFPSNVTGGLQDNVQAYYVKFINDLPNIAAPPGMDPDEFKSIVIAQAKPVISQDKFHYYFYLNGDRVRDTSGKPITMNLADGVQYQPPAPPVLTGHTGDSGISSFGP